MKSLLTIVLMGFYSIVFSKSDPCEGYFILTNKDTLKCKILAYTKDSTNMIEGTKVKYIDKNGETQKMKAEDVLGFAFVWDGKLRRYASISNEFDIAPSLNYSKKVFAEIIWEGNINFYRCTETDGNIACGKAVHYIFKKEGGEWMKITSTCNKFTNKNEKRIKEYFSDHAGLLTRLKEKDFTSEEFFRLAKEYVKSK